MSGNVVDPCYLPKSQTRSLRTGMGNPVHDLSSTGDTITCAHWIHSWCLLNLDIPLTFHEKAAILPQVVIEFQAL